MDFATDINHRTRLNLFMILCGRYYGIQLFLSDVNYTEKDMLPYTIEFSNNNFTWINNYNKNNVYTENKKDIKSHREYKKKRI